MKYIVVDFEMNKIKKEFRRERAICLCEIIEIGAVLLDHRFQEVDSFKTLVKMEYNHGIEKKIEKLTGITTQMVENAPNFRQAVNQFLHWCNAISGEVQFIQWSPSDYHQLTAEMELKGIDRKPFGRYLTNWQDFQKEFNEELGLERQVSLSDALNYAGLDFHGQKHDALFDARNTAALLEIIRVPEKKSKMLNTVIDALKPKNDGVLLGDLFDFSQLSWSN